MADKSAIEWTDATWNPVRGCRRVSRGCENCYAERLAATRLSGPGRPYEGLAEMTPAGPRWTGVVRLVPELLDQPLRWRRPRRVFVNSMSDMFHEGLTDEQIDQVFAVMAACPQHTFQILTKRPERMLQYARRVAASVPHDAVNAAVFDLANAAHGGFASWPLPNVWLGTSVEDQATADERIPHLLETPAAVRFVSAEPLLGPVNLGPWIDRCRASRHVNGWTHGWRFDGDDPYVVCTWCGERRDNLTGRAVGTRRTAPGLDWVIVGGESGPGARPMHPGWARSLRDQCQVAGTAFFFKQWGGWAPVNQVPMPLEHAGRLSAVRPDGTQAPRDEPVGAGAEFIWRAGKHTSGRLLDGRTWDEFPTLVPT